MCAATELDARRSHVTDPDPVVAIEAMAVEYRSSQLAAAAEEEQAAAVRTTSSV